MVALLDAAHIPALNQGHTHANEQEHFALLDAVIVELVVHEKSERELEARVQEQVQELSKAELLQLLQVGV